MKSRPRSVEREVAAHLSNFYASIGLPSVKRIPILGRTGPDIEINDFGLVIDVKSRIEVPKSYVQDVHHIIVFDQIGQNTPLMGIRLENMDELLADYMQDVIEYRSKSSKIVQDYYNHMDEWTKEFYPSCITALVLHRPKMPIGKSVLIISFENRRRFSQWTIHK